jgi:hypothetical protein
VFFGVPKPFCDVSEVYKANREQRIRGWRLGGCGDEIGFVPEKTCFWDVDGPLGRLASGTGATLAPLESVVMLLVITTSRVSRIGGAWR